MLAALLAAASTSLLSVLKYVLLVLLWLFFLLVLRGVLTEVRRPLETDSTLPAKPGSGASRLAGSMRPSAARPDPFRPPDPARPLARFGPSSALPRPAPGPSDPRPAPAPATASSPRPFDPERFDPSPWVAGLTVREPSRSAGLSFLLGDEAILGRSASSTVALPEDSFISSTHARVWRQAGQVMVEDLGSTNGTFVNGNRLTAPTALNPGDQLQVGKTVLEATR